MVCEFEVKEIKDNSVLVMDKKGIVKCVNKDEFLKDILKELREVKTINEQCQIRMKQAEERCKNLENSINKKLHQIANLVGGNVNE